MSPDLEAVMGALCPILEHRDSDWFCVCHYLALPSSFLTACTESSLGICISYNKALGAVFNFS